MRNVVLIALIAATVLPQVAQAQPYGFSDDRGTVMERRRQFRNERRQAEGLSPEAAPTRPAYPSSAYQGGRPSSGRYPAQPPAAGSRPDALQQGIGALQRQFLGR